MLDYHMHTTHSWDGMSTMEEMCKSAINKGVSEICFTEHLSVREGDPCFGWLDMDAYGINIEKCRDHFQGSLTIKKGLEIGEPHLSMNKIEPYKTGQNIDFIIGSVHNLDEEDLTVYMQGREQIESYTDYFNEVLLSVTEGDMDVIGHFDLLKRYAFDLNGKYRHGDYEELISEILKKAISRNIGLEINTSGFRSSSLEIFPSQIILKMYMDLGGELLTVGSDSHSANMIGNNIAPVYLMLKQIGFNAVFSYDRRKPTAVNI
ncbi:histidinol-phosphatase HisJ family protein [Alkalibacter saccharofermentans]|nr:histidinol-phosphatase HisJ family protein [Alkalibacter saccharofermentans]